LHQVSIAAMILGEFMVSFEQYLCWWCCCFFCEEMMDVFWFNAITNAAVNVTWINQINSHIISVLLSSKCISCCQVLGFFHLLDAQPPRA
jgi:hypothetical protein